MENAFTRRRTIKDTSEIRETHWGKKGETNAQRHNTASTHLYTYPHTYIYTHIYLYIIPYWNCCWQVTTVREASKKAKEIIMVQFQKLQKKMFKMHDNLVPKKQSIATYLVHDGPVVIFTYYRLLHFPHGKRCITRSGFLLTSCVRIGGTKVELYCFLSPQPATQWVNYGSRSPLVFHILNISWGDNESWTFLQHDNKYDDQRFQQHNPSRVRPFNLVFARHL